VSVLQNVVEMALSISCPNGSVFSLYYDYWSTSVSAVNRPLARNLQWKHLRHFCLQSTKGGDTLESFLLKVAFESDFRKKSCTCVMKTFAIFLLSKETFTIRTCPILASFFRKLLSKATFERKLSSVSPPLGRKLLQQPSHV